MKRSTLAAVAAVAGLTTVAGLAAPAQAIVGGDQDHGRHPNVAMLDIALSDGRFQVCSGTLIAPEVVLTAAHCVAVGTATAESVLVSFVEEPVYDDNFVLQAPFLTGHAVAHPNFNPSSTALASLQFDIAVVNLDRPATDLWPGLVPAPLPGVGALDPVFKGPRHLFGIVGYGIFDAAGRGRPGYDTDTIVRRTAAMQLRQLTVEFVFANALNSRSQRTGMICSGDSGGPLLAGTAVVGVTSFHRNLSPAPQKPQTPFSGCEGESGFVRLDTASAVGFLADFM